MEKNNQTEGSGVVGWLQKKLKRYGKFYYFAVRLFSPVFVSPRFKSCCRRCLDKYDGDSVIVNIGSGPEIFYNRADIINIDIFAFDEVDVLADGSFLPFKNDSVDCIFNLAMLEHVRDPAAVVKEMHRVIKPYGTVVGFAPFMVPFHAAPSDFYRWTENGLYEMFSNFDTVEVKIATGPTSGMLWPLEEWLATLFSFGSKILHDLWFIGLMCLLFPVKYLDVIIERFPTAANCASGFFVVAQKKA